MIVWPFKLYRWGFTWGKLMLSWSMPASWPKYKREWGFEICWGGISEECVICSTFDKPPANWTRVDIPGEKP